MNLLLSPLALMARDRPRWVIAIAAAVTIVLGGFAANQSTDTQLTSFAPDSELATALDRATVEFGSGGDSLQVIVDAGAGGNVLTTAGIETAMIVEDAVLDHAATTGDEIGMISSFAQPILGALAADGVELADATDADLAAAVLAVSADGGPPLTSQDADPTGPTAAAGLVIVSFPPALDQLVVDETSVALAEMLAGLDTAAFELSPFNAAVLGDALLEQSESEMPMLLGLSLLLILGIMLVLYRTVSDVVIAFVGLVTSIVWMMGIGVILGPDYLGLIGPFSQIAMIVPVLLVALGIDYAIHTTARYREERSHGVTPSRSAATAVRTVGGALALATATTMVGFLTNLVSPLPPMADFGVFTAVGVLSAFVIITAVAPSARNILDTRRARRGRPITAPRPAGGLGAVIGRSAILAERTPKAVLAVALGVSLLATAGATQVSTTFGQDDFIPDGSDIDLLLDRMDELFAGDVNEVTFVIVDGDVTSTAATDAVTDFGATIAGIDGVRANGSDAQMAFDVAPGGASGLISISTNAGQDGAVALAAALEPRLEPLRAAGLSAVVTSELLVIDEALDALTASQTRAIVITLVAALLLLAGYYGVSNRKPVLGVITMVPSLAVVSWVLGTMWILGISFNVLTAMVASLGIGIGVPFGIHVTHRFLEDRRRYDTIDEAIRHTVGHTGGALAASAATTAAGFGVLMFASLTPMRQFGMIVAITIVYSFIAAVLIQPSCLKLWAEHRARRGDHATLLAHEHREFDPAEPGHDTEVTNGTTNGMREPARTGQPG